MLMTLAAPPVFAAGNNVYTKGDFTISATNGGIITEGTDFSYENNVLTIKSAKAMTISGNTTTDCIKVQKDVSANITLNGVNIDVWSYYDSDKVALEIEDDSKGDVKITLAPGTTNILKSGGCCAGLQKNGTYSDGLGTLTIDGSGSLHAQSGSLELGSGDDKGMGAGIGGGKNKNSAKIKISGGSITAKSKDGAGIGGGNCGSGSYITVTNGTVNASAADLGAGIGGGYKGDGSNITISGGKVVATANNAGAGIGGGDEGCGSSITIKDATVIANAGGNGSNGAGIGGGGYSEGEIKDIVIKNSTVTAIGGYGAGIGS